MDIQLSIALIGIAAALLGSAIGGLTSYLSTKSTRKLEWRLSLIEKDISKREDLYADFLSEANKLILLAHKNKIEDPTRLEKLVNLENKIRLMSPTLGDLTRKITSCVLDHHEAGDNKKGSYPELRDSFIKDCRELLNKLKSDAK